MDGPKIPTNLEFVAASYKFILARPILPLEILSLPLTAPSSPSSLRGLPKSKPTLDISVFKTVSHSTALKEPFLLNCTPFSTLVSGLPPRPAALKVFQSAEDKKPD